MALRTFPEMRMDNPDFERWLAKRRPSEVAGYRLFKQHNPEGMWTHLDRKQRRGWVAQADDSDRPHEPFPATQ